MTFGQDQLVHGRYVLEARLGKGGMSNVYRALDTLPRTPIHVAIKQFDLGDLPSGLDSTNARNAPGIRTVTREKAAAQFKYEAGLLHDLEHPNLPHVTDYFESGDERYLVMDLIEGEDLDRKLEGNNHRPLPESQVLGWMRQVMDALDYCHRSGVIHRDVKPSNIIVTPAGKAYLVDFGIAQLSDGSEIGIRARSRGFSSPEQEEGSETDSRSDIYSLGATLYALLAGTNPEAAGNRVKGTELKAPSYFNASLSPHLEAVTLHAMALNPDERYPTVRSFRTALMWPLMVRRLIVGSAVMLTVSTMAGAALFIGGFLNQFQATPTISGNITPGPGIAQATSAVNVSTSASTPIARATEVPILFTPADRATTTPLPMPTAIPLVTVILSPVPTDSPLTVTPQPVPTPTERPLATPTLLPPTRAPTATATATVTPTVSPRYGAVVLREPQNGQSIQGDTVTVEWQDANLQNSSDRYLVFFRLAASQDWAWQCRPVEKGTCTLDKKAAKGNGAYEWSVFIVDGAEHVVSQSGEIRRFRWGPDPGGGNPGGKGGCGAYPCP